MADPSSRARCPICPHHCRLSEGQLGLCRARRAIDGCVVDENYGRITSIALDPIEKKPLARFMAGKKVLSVGSYGCNLRCPFCQNASIACGGATTVPWRQMEPEELVDLARDLTREGNVGIAYTYNEPLVGFEFVYETSRLVHEAAMVNVLVSNGMVDSEPLSRLVPLVDAANIDLKGFTQRFYDLVGGDLSCVKETIAALAAAPTCHLEITTLVIPDLNDDAEQIAQAARWLASLSEDIVYHLTRFFPSHRMAHSQPTPVQTIYGLVDVARQYLPHVLPGNI